MRHTLTPNNRRRSSLAKAISAVCEVVEPRRLLSSTLIDADSASHLSNAGDFYWYHDQKISLLRDESSVIVKFRDNAQAPEIAGVTAPGGVLEDFALQSHAKGDQAIFKRERTSHKTSDVIASLRQAANVEWAAVGFVTASTSSPTWISDQIIVELRPGTNVTGFMDRNAILAYEPLGLNGYVLTLNRSGDRALAFANALHDDPRVAWAQPNFRITIDFCSTPTDPMFSNQWALENNGQHHAVNNADTNVPLAWDVAGVGSGRNDVVIAVLDDGVDLTHPDLQSNVWVNANEIPGDGKDNDGNGYIDDVNGWDFYANDNTPQPGSAYDNHGTAVAGVAAAVGDNGLGVTGVSQHSKILPIRICEATSTTTTFRDLATAVYYASGLNSSGSSTWRGADIINMSFALDVPNAAFEAAINAATTRGRGGLGTPVFCASGNSALSQGFREFTLTGFTQGTYMVEWRYTKNASTSAGSDAAWLGGVELPDGTVQRFDQAGMPSGWSTSGSAFWTVQDDPAHTYGTGRYTVRSGAIGNNQTTALQSPTFAVATGQTGTLRFRYLTSSEKDNDQLKLYVSSNGGATWNEQPFQASGVSTSQQGIAYPASLSSTIPGVCAVGASTDCNYRADYSQYGAGLDFVAPSSGGFNGIYTTDRQGEAGYNSSSDGDPIDTNYTSTFGGTSAAAPHAAGIAALLLSRNPGLSAAEVRSILRANCANIGGVTYDSNGWNTLYGYGRLNAKRIVDATNPVNGTDGNDTITVTQNASNLALLDVNINGTVTQIAKPATGGKLYINGYDGADLIDASALSIPVVIFGGRGMDTLIGGSGNDTLVGSDGKDSIVGGDGNDSIDGGAGDDTICGGLGDDTLNGGAGNDSVVGGLGNDVLRGGAGWDRISYEDHTPAQPVVAVAGTCDTVNNGTTGENDYITGDFEMLIGGEGDDTLSTNAASGFSLAGNGGNDRLTGGPGNDSFWGGPQNDTILGLGGNDALRGEAGNDSLVGGDGYDSIDGGADNDTLIGGAGNDTLKGGTGNDTADYSGSTVGIVVSATLVSGIGSASGLITVKLADNSETDTLGSRSADGYGSPILDDVGAAEDTDIENFIGTEQADMFSLASQWFTPLTWFDPISRRIDARGGNDTILTGYGADLILAGAGNDSVDAGQGDDTIYGGEGNDTLCGGAFEASSRSVSGRDLIYGEGGNDVIYARGDSQMDTIDGGTGTDSAQADTNDVLSSIETLLA